MFALVRTSRGERKQHGITFVLIEMTSPGITIRPLVMTSGEQIQNQVFFDEVRVPKANVIGEIDSGWTVAKYLLEFERGGGAVAPGLQVMAEEIAEAAKGQPGLADDYAFTHSWLTRVSAPRWPRAATRCVVVDAQDLGHRTQPTAH